MKPALFPLLFSLLGSTAHAAPQIQKDALYFSDINQDLAWFAAEEKVVPVTDPRGLFLRIYDSVTREMVTMFAEKKFENPEWVNALMLKYVSLYRNALDCELSGACPVAPAWQIAFAENQRGRFAPAVQLLISISAHVNRDLPIALVETPGTDFNGASVHRDFQEISEIFQRRMPEMIRITQGYQRCRVNATDERIINDIIHWAIGRTREESWTFGARLVSLSGGAPESALLNEIEAHARYEDQTIRLFAPAPGALICLPGI